MTKNLKRYFIKSIIVLALIHLAYFLYGYFTFEGLKNIDIYTEFYRFKFYDDVSISHFFVSGLFLLLFLIFLIRNHSRENYKGGNLFKIAVYLLLISFLTFSFFISYSFGMNAKLKTELSENDFNNDKKLLNVLNPFLYGYTSYSSEKLFNYENILYPKPYPVIQQEDTIVPGEYAITETSYYSIDTIKALTSTFDKTANKADSIFDILGFDKEELHKRIISKTVLGDSTEIIFKGAQVRPEHESDICIFLENKSLFSPVQGDSVDKQRYQAAVDRYKLLYNSKKDSLTYTFQKLDTILKKYNIETNVIPKLLTQDVYHYRDNKDEPLNGIRNTFDRKALTEKFKTLNKLFYEPNYLHPNIIAIYFAVIVAVWIVLFLFYILFNKKKVQ
ncbi:hypothetical protein [Flavobacterium nitrogenifigens]|uniref:Uncharacterized protein n=1 Tax=Flavobacterium nitrogenifigens TaxID=1617283 RepID=A0A521DYY4_9FLAO|nr:hypothetical protein [Flavobacterium nitrogenifigens]KAF2333966.1 hypothetical protein DM397_08610 [Flavobacterium nitrogenifigens]SMO76927.1 hypothetical protein SAMN06265220_103660 [Flavobacterium nitrogenifigens]